MLRVFFLLVFSSFIFCQVSFAQSNWQEQLDKNISQRDKLDAAKKETISTLLKNLQSVKEEKNTDKEFAALMQMVKAYEYFVYDSAFKYVQTANRLAYGLKDEAKIAESKSKLSLIMLLKGLYTSSIDTIKTVNYQFLSKQKRKEFYSTAYRAYYDLSAYSRDKYYSDKYKEQGHYFSRKLIDEFPEPCFEKVLGMALQEMVSGDLSKAEKHYLNLLNQFDLNDHEKAIVTSGLGSIYSARGETKKAKDYLMQASIADIKSATKETTACRSLAELFYRDGDIDKAYQYILLAKADADFYGSEQRKFEISYTLPLIESARFQKENKQKRLVGLIGLLVLAFSLIILRQLQKLRQARKEIESSNQNLTHVNEMLREASQIKEEYIGYYFNFSSQYIDKLEDFKKSISRQLITKSYDNIEQELKKYNSKNERKRLFEDFDRIFLKLFPDFVQAFNQLFDKKDGIHLKDDLSLNTDLRIFALIRIGVADSEKIASILNLSVNTIYTYKTKIRNRSIYPNDEFDLKVMAIKSV
ncbi:DUF6377 domain-containing protein [Ancylomarina sp. 16SWW S1-10-2]|uniref:DUF6377 domain-containing protein n=1 Tax=Ancylomarina sp. 16SWW S1-10-2 TaxID=2499681 RepID=UPI0012ADBA20|nr:DUF6377 domain-containing protein [Ancylomarina sp. 16SWW S1-10-2]MRT93475.1 hypothetical protein [Ancylomarina sp. 16SWW S1-10-2]